MKQDALKAKNIKSTFQVVAWLSLCLLATSAKADLRAFKAEYEVKYMRMRAAEVTIDLQQKDENNWFMSRRSKAIGLARLMAGDKLNLHEQSWFELSDEHLMPNKFLLEKPGAKEGRRRIEVMFTESQATITTDAGQSRIHAKTEHSQDQVSAVVAVMLKLQSQQKSFTLPIMARRGESIASFEVLEGGKIKTPAGVFDTEHIVQKNKKRTTNYWLAKDHNMVPVKILHQEDDDEGAVMVLKTLSFPEEK